MDESAEKQYGSKSSKNSYTPNYHGTWGGVIITFLAAGLVFFLSKYFSS